MIVDVPKNIMYNIELQKNTSKNSLFAIQIHCNMQHANKAQVAQDMYHRFISVNNCLPRIAT